MLQMWANSGSDEHINRAVAEAAEVTVGVAAGLLAVEEAGPEDHVRTATDAVRRRDPETGARVWRTARRR
jgi:hypothetical protein